MAKKKKADKSEPAIVELIGPAGRKMVPSQEVPKYLAKGFVTVDDYIKGGK